LLAVEATTMSDPFLVLPGTKGIRTRKPEKRPTQVKRTQGGKDGRVEKKKRRMRERSAPAEDDDEIGPGRIDDSDIEVDDASEESETEETPAERRLRLAKEYLDRVRVEAGLNPSVPFKEK
jgi:ribosomal RNA-processing protein 9